MSEVYKKNSSHKLKIINTIKWTLCGFLMLNSQINTVILQTLLNN